jgi:hypothetical protein
MILMGTAIDIQGTAMRECVREMARVCLLVAERVSLVKLPGAPFAAESEWTNGRKELTILNAGLARFCVSFQSVNSARSKAVLVSGCLLSLTLVSKFQEA